MWWVNQFRTGQLAGQKAARKSLESVDARKDNEEKSEEEKQKELDSRPRTELETTWNKVLMTEGEEEVIFSMDVLRIQIDPDKIKSAIENFSPAGREYYMKLFTELMKSPY